MKYVIFMIFSSLESFSIIFLGLILFRKRINPKMITTSMIIGATLALSSLSLYLLGRDTISPLIQLLIMIFLTIVLFKISIMRSIFISVAGYFVFSVVQAFIIILTNYYHLISFNELKPFTVKGEIIQLSSFIIVLLIVAVIKKTNEGYAFDPEENGNKIKYTNRIFMLTISISLIVLSSVFYEYKTTQIFYSIIVFFIVAALAMISFLYISLKRDQENSDIR